MERLTQLVTAWPGPGPRVPDAQPNSCSVHLAVKLPPLRQSLGAACPTSHPEVKGTVPVYMSRKIIPGLARKPFGKNLDISSMCLLWLHRKSKERVFQNLSS